MSSIDVLIHIGKHTKISFLISEILERYIKQDEIHEQLPAPHLSPFSSLTDTTSQLCFCYEFRVKDAKEFNV
jgi:hypothetical protein